MSDVNVLGMQFIMIRGISQKYIYEVAAALLIPATTSSTNTPWSTTQTCGLCTLLGDGFQTLFNVYTRP